MSHVTYDCRYMRSIVLQCAAVCCSMLQYVAVCCSVLQYVAVCCSMFAACYHVTYDCRHLGQTHRSCICVIVLQTVAVCYDVLHCIAVWSNVLQRLNSAEYARNGITGVAVRCSALLGFALCCIVLQRVNCKHRHLCCSVL